MLPFVQKRGFGGAGCASEGWKAGVEGPGRGLWHPVSSACLTLLLDPVILKSETIPAHPDNELAFRASHLDRIHVLCSRNCSNHLEVTGGTREHVGSLGGGGPGEGLDSPSRLHTDEHVPAVGWKRLTNPEHEAPIQSSCGPAGFPGPASVVGEPRFPHLYVGGSTEALRELRVR